MDEELLRQQSGPSKGSVILALACLLYPPPSLRLGAAGDIMLGRWVEKRLLREGPQAPWKPVDALFGGTELRFANLECVLTTRPVVTENRYSLRARPELAVGLKGRFDVLSVANNHALDCGPEGLAETVRTLQRLGIQPVGLAHQPVILTKHGVRLGFLGYSAFPAPQLGNLATWREDVAALKPKVDLVVVSIHWGVEMTLHATKEQQSISEEMHRAGVALILGHHPHVWQETLLADQKGTAFSLGDFVFDSPAGPRRETGILRIALNKDGVAAIEKIPAKIDRYFARPEQTKALKAREVDHVR